MLRVIHRTLACPTTSIVHQSNVNDWRDLGQDAIADSTHRDEAVHSRSRTARGVTETQGLGDFT